MSRLICHTEGCQNVGLPIDVDITDPDTGEQLPVMCGPCGNPITDITEVPPA